MAYRHEDGSLRWYVAKTIGRPSRAAFYLRRSGLEAFYPIIHRYFIDKRSHIEKFRETALLPGYVFFIAQSKSDFGRAVSCIGVHGILGFWRDGEHIPIAMPSIYMGELIVNSPIIEGKRRKYCTGELVKVALAGVRDIIASVESHDGAKVRIKTTILGQDTIVSVNQNLVSQATSVDLEEGLYF